MAFKMAPKSPLMKSLKGGQKNLPEGLKKAIEAAPGKMMDSPAKMGRGERYDVKMASDQNLTAGARKNYAENAEAAQKSSPAKNMNKGYGSPAKNMNKGYGTPSPMKAEMALSIEDSNYKKEVKAAKKSSPAKQTTKGVIKKTVKITPTRKIKSTKTKKANKTSTKTLISKEVRNPVGGLNVKPAPKTSKLTKSPVKQTKLARQAARTNKKIQRDHALADRNPERATKRGERLMDQAHNMRHVKNPEKHPERNQRRSDKYQERLVRAFNIDKFFVPNSKKNK